jgi:hypothetical protein
LGKPKLDVSLARSVAFRTLDASRATLLLSSCNNQSTTEVCGRHVEPAILLRIRARRQNPLGETCNWGMKASRQRDYIGVHGQRVVQEKAKEGCEDRLRPIRLVPGRKMGKVTIAVGKAEGRLK